MNEFREETRDLGYLVPTPIIDPLCLHSAHVVVSILSAAVDVGHFGHAVSSWSSSSSLAAVQVTFRSI